MRHTALEENDERGSDGALVAEGDFTHVFCDRTTRRPVPIEGDMRTAMERLVLG
ncbi:hypothetical protein GCM10022226_12500 [Sphaerisporangium flaviroseum]|uniref:Uncharacterized protein n=1 Tax=Sphaerisporangium flaviroseum TaxID=509199 RepID=A0ABP7HMR6_9ACTN